MLCAVSHHEQLLFAANNSPPIQKKHTKNRLDLHPPTIKSSRAAYNALSAPNVCPHPPPRVIVSAPKLNRTNLFIVPIDSQQFRTLALAELQSVYRLAHHLARNTPDADDLVQETYARAFKSEDSFKLAEAGVRPWLLKILHNVFLTKIKRARLEPVATDFSNDLAETRNQDAHLAAQALADMDWEQVDERLKAAIHELPLAYRTVFLLSSVEGLKYREVADVLEMPIGTVMSRLYRARTMLLEQLQDLAAELRLNHKTSPTTDETSR
jgi:RNA polymerase sigma-70 factor (ECF subfamily)